MANRNTFVRAYFDGGGRLTGFDKIVYGEIELGHRYDYQQNGVLKRAGITFPDEEPVSMSFDETGAQIS